MVDYYQQRSAIIALFNAKVIISAIANTVGCSRGYAAKWVKHFQQRGHVRDNPRAGRPRSLSRDAAQTATKVVKQLAYRTAAQVAGYLESQGLGSVSARTVQRELRAAGLKYRKPSKKPLLTAHQKTNRVKFCKKHKKTAWRGFMFTASKYFYLYPVRGGSRLASWSEPGSASDEYEVPKYSEAVHVYMGVTFFGTTRLVFVTGTSKQPSEFFDAKGKRYSGVCAPEYQEKVVPVWHEDGKRLFASSGFWQNSWWVQQDGARIHTVAASMELIKSKTNLLKDWPANSPDLSWIENVWGWMDHQLRKRPQYSNVDELKAALEEIRASIPLSMLQNHVNGMAGRLELCIELEGGYIGK